MKKTSYKSVLAIVLTLATIMSILSGCKSAPKEQDENYAYTYQKTIYDEVMMWVIDSCRVYDEYYDEYVKTGPMPSSIYKENRLVSYGPDYCYLDMREGLYAKLDYVPHDQVFHDPNLGDIVKVDYFSTNWSHEKPMGWELKSYDDLNNEPWTTALALADEFMELFGDHPTTSNDFNWDMDGRGAIYPADMLGWCEWHIMHDDSLKQSGAPFMDCYKNMTMEEYMAYRKAMSKNEAYQFRDRWYEHGMVDYLGLFNKCNIYHVIHDREIYNKSFDKWYEETYGQVTTPIHGSTAVDPVVTPTPVPTVTPTPVPSETPVPTPTPAPTVTPEPETPVQHFPDVTPDKWYYEAVNNMAEAGILKGHSDGLFHPDDLVTEAEVATIFCRISEDAARAFKADPKSVDEWAKEQGHWSAKFIAYAKEGPTSNRMTMMYYTGVDRADLPETREYVFNAISEYIYAEQFVGKYCYRRFIDGIHYYTEPLVDKDKVSTMFWEYLDGPKGGLGMTSGIANLVYLGIIHGDQNGNLNLDSNITRAELCQVLYNMGATIDWLSDGK